MQIIHQNQLKLPLSYSPTFWQKCPISISANSHKKIFAVVFFVFSLIAMIFISLMIQKRRNCKKSEKINRLKIEDEKISKIKEEIIKAKEEAIKVKNEAKKLENRFLKIENRRLA